MVSRTESAAATRRALLDAAAELLDTGGPDAVTLRAVGARAGVTRGAPYRHFADKDSLLTTVASEALERLAEQVRAVRADPQSDPAERLQHSLSALMAVGRHQPHLYRLMFTYPSGDADTIRAANEAADQAQNEFLAAVREVVGTDRTRRVAPLLLTSVHGITDMEANGHLSPDKWHITADELVATLVSMIGQQADPR